ncbi:RmlC-like cupin domain-containing protein [Trichoderma chlorosporum]
MPNETAPAHRHTAFAMRFIIEGSGGFTAAHGRRVKMNRGAVILTPSWNWHDHGKDGSGLPRYPAEDVDTDNSPIVFPWAKMQSRLDAERATDYRAILGGSAERLNASISSPAFRETASSVYHIVEGSGHSVIDGEVFKWEKGDTFCITAWKKALGFLRTEGVDVETLVSQ